MADVHVTFDDHAIALMARQPEALAAVDRAAGELVNAIKRRAPVSPVTSGHSGHLRSSIHAFQQGDGSVIIGPTADYTKYVIETPAALATAIGANACTLTIVANAASQAREGLSSAFAPAAPVPDVIASQQLDRKCWQANRDGHSSASAGKAGNCSAGRVPPGTLRVPL